MAAYEFSLSSLSDQSRRAGIVRSDTFAEALELIAEQAEVEEGDTLEIGVRGFPPAQYQYVFSSLEGAHNWHPTGRLAA